MQLFRTFLIWVDTLDTLDTLDTWLELSTTETLGKVRLSGGVVQWLDIPEPDLLKLSELTCENHRVLSGIAGDLLATATHPEWSLIGEKLLVANFASTAEKIQ
jgi:hypothetical protein